MNAVFILWEPRGSVWYECVSGEDKIMSVLYNGQGLYWHSLVLCKDEVILIWGRVLEYLQGGLVWHRFRVTHCSSVALLSPSQSHTLGRASLYLLAECVW